MVKEELSDIEIAVQEVIKKATATIYKYSDSSKVNVEKKKAEDIQQKKPWQLLVKPKLY